MTTDEYLAYLRSRTTEQLIDDMIESLRRWAVEYKEKDRIEQMFINTAIEMELIKDANN